MNKKKVLIISASAGAGHVRAAQALEKTAKLDFSDTLISKHIDLVDFVNLPTKKAFFHSYGTIVKQLPELWGFMYKKMDIPKNKRHFDRATKILQKLNSKKFLQEIESFSPDHIIHTHFTSSDLIRASHRNDLISIPQTVVITDYDIHQLWIGSPDHRYCVATDKMKWKLAQRGIHEDNISITGIPIDPVFYEQKERGALAKQYAIDQNKKTLLALGGGQGLIKLHRVVEKILEANIPLNLIAVAGNNNILQHRLKKLVAPPHVHYVPLGWTDAIDEYMRLSDVILTKPGGITTTECIALNKPMIMIDPIPGQEERNAAFVMQHGLGVTAQDIDDIIYYAQQHLHCTASLPKHKPANQILSQI